MESSRGRGYPRLECRHGHSYLRIPVEARCHTRPEAARDGRHPQAPGPDTRPARDLGWPEHLSPLPGIRTRGRYEVQRSRSPRSLRQPPRAPGAPLLAPAPHRACRGRFRVLSLPRPSI